MKLVMILDQIQAGAGGKEHAEEGLHAKSGPIGSAKMFEPYFKKYDIEVIACMYCGDLFYEKNKEEVQTKIIAMIKKLNPDAVLCGPAFNYVGYAKMCVELAEVIQKETSVAVIASCSQENEDSIEAYKEKVHIVKMPKKGGIGLSDSLDHMCSLLHKMVHKETIDEYIESVCY